MTDVKMTILIVDDKPANIFALETLLERSDRTILSANSGPDCLKIVLNQPVDLIILDVQMPEMDGFEVVQILKSHKRTKDIPIIFASAEKKEKQSMIKGFEEGAIDYLPKPLDPELTKAKVSVLLKIEMQKKELLEKNISLEKAENQIRTLNADLQKNLRQLEAVNKELESFSYSVSHDLRAPLRSIMGYSKAIVEDYAEKLDAEGNRLLQIVLQNAARMNTLIDDLLEFSRLSKKEVSKAALNMNELVQNILTDLHRSPGHHAKIHLDHLESAKADHSLIRQVWINLISNAIKYSSKKTTPEITIGSYRNDEDDIIFYVKDNGAGFDMNYANKLFHVFQRLHGVAEFEGTGVGLAIVHRIISRHGGKVWAEGVVNEGASFFFSLPVN